MYRDFSSMSPLIARAYEIASRAHAGQVDKGGHDYIYHPLTVASRMGDDEAAIIVGLLHDVCEDTSVTLEELSREFPPEIIEAVDCLTHREGVPYLDYVAEVKTNAIARKVKVADLEHNMDLTRISDVTEEDLQRLEHKYKPALKLLTDCE